MIHKNTHIISIYFFSLGSPSLGKLTAFKSAMSWQKKESEKRIKGDDARRRLVDIYDVIWILYIG